LWNGPMGVAEVEVFSSGTEEVAFAVTQVGQSGATVVIGGAIPGMLAWHVCMH
jgi:3-phosphoglycerate kinase